MIGDPFIWNILVHLATRAPWWCRLKTRSNFIKLNLQGGSRTTSFAWKYIKVCGYSDRFCKTWTKGHWPLDDLWPHICWGLMCDSTQGSLCPNPMKIHQSMWIHTGSEKMHFSREYSYISHHFLCRPISLCQKSKFPSKLSNFPQISLPDYPFFPTMLQYSDLFCKKLEPGWSLTPRWPLTPHLLRSNVWLYPRIIVSKSHENTSKYVDTVTLFAKTWTKGLWPLDDLWPHICWGHMCNSTQGSLCPSPMGIHQCMWIQWSIL